MKHLITYDELIDAALASSALCGDLTGRGSMLVDNDDAALRAFLAFAVPSALSENNIPFKDHDKGWRIGPTNLPKGRLTAFLVGQTFGRLSDMTQGASPDIDEPDMDDFYDSIEPHYY